MSERPWYRRFGGDFVMGTMALTLEEKGAYSLCLDLIYDRRGPIPDDARWLAGICGVSVRKWNALRDRLIEAGKLIEIDGRLTNARAQKELAADAKTSRKHAENGAKGGRKVRENRAEPNENNYIDQARLKPRACVPEPDKYSVSNETDAEPASRQAPVESQPRQDQAQGSDPNKESWDRAGRLLKSRRSLFGKLLRDYRLEPRDMLPSLVACELTGTLDPPSYLRKAAAAVAQRRGTLAPTAENRLAAWGDDEWKTALEIFAESGRWHADYGPLPGEPGCRVPAHLLLSAA